MVTEVFVTTGNAIAQSWGMSGYAFAVTLHPIVIQSPAELERWAAQTLPQVIAVLDGAPAPAQIRESGEA